MSLSDPNVLRHLFSAGRAARAHDRPTVFLPLQAFPALRHRIPVEANLRHAMRRRLDKVGVRTESPDFFSQVPQFINEITVARQHSVAGNPPDVVAKSRYSRRLRAWRSEMEQAKPAKVDLDHDDAFAEIQNANHAVLRGTRVLLYSIVDDFLRSQTVRERFAIQLWARNPHTRYLSLEMWGSSEKAWLERETLLRATIEPDSPYNAVRAFCAGGVLHERSAKAGSRWARSMACLIYLGGRWHQLPVGVIVLESNFDEESCLTRLDGPQRESVSTLLRAVGEALLDPSVTTAEVRDATSELAEEPTPSVQAATEAIQKLLNREETDLATPLPPLDVTGA